MSGQLEFGEEDRSATLRRVWELCLHLLATKVSKVTFSSYVETAQPLSYVGNQVTVGVTSPFAREWLEKKATNAIRSALEFHLDTTGIRVEFVVMTREQQRAHENATHTRRPDPNTPRTATSLQATLPLETDLSGGATPSFASGNSDSGSSADSGNSSSGKQGTTASTPAASTSAAPTLSAPALKPPTGHRANGRKPEGKTTHVARPPIPCLPLNERYVFETFLLGRSNRLAHAGATSVAARPSEVYNPLFLYGGPGLGKTHLLQGIAHSLRRTNPEMRVAYVSGEYFAQSYITAIREHATEEFRRQYRDIDVWLVDDIQFVAGKEHTKEEFFHTFNALYQNGKQIVIASDRSPRELNTMDERLRSRFQSGLIADIGAPELETRIAILQQCRERESAAVSDEVLDYIASAIQSNVRALEGALTRLIACSSIMNVHATAELAQSVLKEYFIDKPIRLRKITVEEIIEAVSEQFDTTATALKGPNRNKDVSLARHVAMYICRDLLPEFNTTQTGTAFGGRDHATIVYACQRIKALREVDTELRALIAQLIKRLSA